MPMTIPPRFKANASLSSSSLSRRCGRIVFRFSLGGFRILTVFLGLLLQKIYIVIAAVNQRLYDLIVRVQHIAFKALVLFLVCEPACRAVLILPDRMGCFNIRRNLVKVGTV